MPNDYGQGKKEEEWIAKGCTVISVGNECIVCDIVSQVYRYSKPY